MAEGGLRRAGMGPRRAKLAWAIFGAIVGGLAFAFLAGAGWFEPALWLAPAFMLAGAVLAAIFGSRAGPPISNPPDVGVRALASDQRTAAAMMEGFDVDTALPPIDFGTPRASLRAPARPAGGLS